MAEQVQQVTMKDPKKVEQGKKLAEWNRKNKGKLAHEAQKSESETNLTYYGAVVAIGMLGVISYYVYQFKTPVNQPKESPVHQRKRTPDKFNMN